MLGLGDIGPQAAMPVMEGKAMLFKEFAGVDAFPICLDTRIRTRSCRVVQAIAPGFGGINLEDISAPRCFEIEDRLDGARHPGVSRRPARDGGRDARRAVQRAEVVAADRSTSRVVVSAWERQAWRVTRILMAAGARHVIGCDSRGAV